MCVTEAYSDGTTDSRGYRLTLNDTPAKVTTAVANAQAIAASAYGTPLQQLTHFKDAICDAVKYNFAAAEDDDMPYGDPWQLVYVFDGDDTTDVVCEGYSKAFKYLCDLTDIDGVDCIIANGDMGWKDEPGGGHMWNVVSMDDGSNYLVDVTNCDKGTSGYPDKLFVATPASGSLDEGYTFFLYEGAELVYTYSDSARSVFSDEELTLAAAPYVSQSDLADATVTGIERCYTYTGRAIEPEPVVTYDGRVLERDVDYTVSYNRNKCPGKATVTITGTGYYVGEQAVTFDIAVGACCAGWGTKPWGVGGSCNPIVQHGLGQIYDAAWAVMRAVHGLCPSFRTFGL